MKVILCISFVLLQLAHCGFGQRTTHHLSTHNSNSQLVKKEDCLLIEKIDSITQTIRYQGEANTIQSDGVYIIYARQENRIYKIVSPRDTRTFRKCIVVGKCYQLRLAGYLTPKPGEPVDLLGVETGGIILNGVVVERDRLSTGELDDIFYDTKLRNLCFDDNISEENKK